jgi:hypothetical protein
VDVFVDVRFEEIRGKTKPGSEGLVVSELGLTNSLNGQRYDAAQTRIREILADLEGVSD